MKFKFIGTIKDKLRKYSKPRNFVTKATAITLAGVMSMSMLTGCGDKTKDADVKATAEQEQTQEVLSNEELMAKIADLEAKVAELEGEDVKESYAYSEEEWKQFSDEAWKNLNGIINNVDRAAFDSALMILNIDFLNTNNPQILRSYYAKGIDVENELNNLYSLLSQIREYNTVNPTDRYLMTVLSLSSNDTYILSTLEDYAAEVVTLKADLEKDGNKKRIQEIFDIVKAFSDGTGKIKVNKEGEEVEVAQIELTKGGVVASENIIQTISVYCQNIVKEESRKDLDKTLRTTDVLAKIQEVMVANNAVAMATEKQISAEEQAEMLEKVNYLRDAVAKELEAFDVTKEEAYSLYTVANINFFMDSKASSDVLKAMYIDGINLNDIFTQAEAAVYKIQMHNRTVTDAKDLYKYNHLFISDKEDILSISALTNTIYELGSTDEKTKDNAAAIIKGYTQYSSQTTVQYKEKDANGNVIEETKKLDKNALTDGATQIADWMTYYALTDYKKSFENDELVKSLTQLVDGSQEGLSTFDNIVLLVDDYCADKNVVVYDYQPGKVKVNK